MMESIRAGVEKPWVKIILGIVVLSFVFAGYFTFSGFGVSPDTVVKVNDEEVKRKQWEDEIANKAARFGEQFDTIFSTDEARNQFRVNVLDELISKQVLLQEIEKLGFRASQAQISETLKQVNSLQVDGKFSTALLDQLIASRGWSRSYFQRMLNDDLVLRQFSSLFNDTEIALPYEIEQRIQLEQQQRSAKTLVIPSEKFVDSVEVSDADIELFYQSNLSQYEIKETLTVEYIELKMDDLAAKVELTEESINEYYQNNQDLYRSEEERRVAHILIKTEQRSEDEAKLKIDEIAEKLRNGADFAELAKTESEDFSGEEGGDLGFAGRGVMVPEFEEAMFSLSAVDDVSEVVKTEFGFHVIKLLEIKAGAIQPLESVRDQIVRRLKNDKAEEEYFVSKGKIAQLAFDRYDSLSPVAADAALEIKTSDAFPPTGGEGIFANPDLLKEAYSESVLMDKRNSGLIDVTEGHLVVLRAKDHTPSRTKALDEVRDQVVASVKQEKVRAAASRLGEEWIALLDNNESIESAIAELGIEWKSVTDVRRNSTELGYELNRLVFKSAKPQNGHVLAQGQSLANGDYAVVQVTEVKTTDFSKMSEAEKKQAQARIQGLMGNSSYAALIESIRKEAEVQRFEDRIK